MTNCLTESPAPQSQTPEREASPMSSPLHAMPEPTGEVWPDPVSTSGTFTRVPALVPRGGTSLFVFDPDGTASGVVTQTEADVSVFVNSVLDRIVWVPTPWTLTSGRCSHAIPTAWPDAVLYCSLAPSHSGLHEPWGVVDGDVMPRPVDDVVMAVA